MKYNKHVIYLLNVTRFAKVNFVFKFVDGPTEIKYKSG